MKGREAGLCVCRHKKMVKAVCIFCFIVFLLFSVVTFSNTDFLKFEQYLTLQPTTDVINSAATTTTRTTTSTVPPVLHNVTIVTAFLDIGEFGKGSPSNKRDHRIYEKWAAAYSRVMAPVVLFTNSKSFSRHFLNVRRELLALTKVVKVELPSLWSFRLKKQIAAIYSGGYPKHWPNTVYPDYTCVTHAKFDCLRHVLDNNYFPSQHLAWMDVGYLRNIAGENSTQGFLVWPPPEFDPERVLCGEVYSPDFSRSWKSILRNNVNWVAGGFFLATRRVINTFVTQYRRAVTAFLHQHESQVEQHILYAMYTKEGRAIAHPTVELQAERGGWFDIGFKCLHLLPTPAPPRHNYSTVLHSLLHTATQHHNHTTQPPHSHTTKRHNNTTQPHNTITQPHHSATAQHPQNYTTTLHNSNTQPLHTATALSHRTASTQPHN